MFGSKRSRLIKRLSSFAAHETQRSVEAVLKQLELAILETLTVAVESRGAQEAPCIVIQPGLLKRQGREMQPRLLFCQWFRWSDLGSLNELRPLPMCKLDLCANPYHYSRLYKPNSPPPPYRNFRKEMTFEEETVSIASEPVSPDSCNTTGFENVLWCKLAYWELTSRVGRLLPVSNPSINVFSDLPQSDGLCLQTLTESCATDNSSILRTREKIGQGITIYKEEQTVWVYNRSDTPLFLNSPTLDPPNTDNLTVYKLLPGYTIKIYDFEKSKLYEEMRNIYPSKNGPFDHNAVRISFAKGFGSSGYSRRFITSCPCWLEIIFPPNR